MIDDEEIQNDSYVNKSVTVPVEEYCELKKQYTNLLEKHEFIVEINNDMWKLRKYNGKNNK